MKYGSSYNNMSKNKEKNIFKSNSKLLCWCYYSRLATVHFVTDRQTDRQANDIMMTIIADHTTWQYEGTSCSLSADHQFVVDQSPQTDCPPPLIGHLLSVQPSPWQRIVTPLSCPYRPTASECDSNDDDDGGHRDLQLLHFRVVPGCADVMREAVRL